MNRALRVVNFYVLCNTLKNLIRTGWKDWNVSSERLESVAEHVYGVQMLALAIYSEYELDLDILKVIYMLAIHELEETIIGDLTFLQISDDDKKKIGHEAIDKILSNLIKGEEIKTIIFEFDERKSKEALFAYHCDKLECDLQCKLYDESNCVDPLCQKDDVEHNKDVMNKLISGEESWSKMWLENDRKKFVDDKVFIELLDYILENDISKK